MVEAWYTSNDNADDSSALQLLITVLQMTWEFVEIEQHLRSATVFHHLGAGKTGSYKGSHGRSPKPNLLSLNLTTFLCKYKCIDG